MKKIFYPDRCTHFDLQAKLYSKLVERGHNVCGEIKHEKSRFDLVVFDEEKANAVCIIEVKNYKVDRDPKVTTKQFKKYNQYGVPVVYCVHVNQIEDAMKQVELAMNERDNH